jgi:hypothetical protein
VKIEDFKPEFAGKMDFYLNAVVDPHDPTPSRPSNRDE